MNLFVLPSWYPSAAQPIAGSFVRDQVAALAELAPELTQVVGLWGHHQGALSPRHPVDSLRALAWRLSARAGWRTDPGGWDEHITPRLSWTLAWRGGGAAGLLRASRRNLLSAQQRHGRFDLIHAHVGFPGGWIAAQLSREFDLPYVLTEHMGPFPVPQLLSRGRPCAQLQQAYAGAARVLAVSPALAARILELGLRCDAVMPNLVDERRWRPSASAPSADAPWLAIARLETIKGLELLLQAWARRRPVPGVGLEIVGAGSQEGALRALADRLGLADQVRWLGPLSGEALAQRVRQARAVVLPSRQESFGVVLVEALLSGRPVLATRCGGPESIVGHADGLLVPVDDVPALTEGLERLDARLAEFDPQALRESALRRFGREAVVAGLLQVYREVLGR